MTDRTIIYVDDFRQPPSETGERKPMTWEDFIRESTRHPLPLTVRDGMVLLIPRCLPSEGNDGSH